jgi:hypothetical protein
MITSLSATSPSHYAHGRDLALGAILNCTISCIQDRSCQKTEVSWKFRNFNLHLIKINFTMETLLGSEWTHPLNINNLRLMPILKCLNTLITNSQFALLVLRYVPRCLRLAVESFTSHAWPVRTAAAQLLCM